MTMIFKENEGISQISSTPEVREWSALGSRLPPAENGNYFLKSLELSGGNKDSTHFTVFPELVKTINVPSSFQPAASMEHLQGHFKLGLGQPQVCAQYPYKEEQLYGIYPVQIEGQRMMVPLSTGINGGGPIFVNVKQYNAIVRRRLSRAKAESKINEEMKTRKPYMHLSRHLHAIRRQRGSGGRFLRTKSEKADVHPVQYSGSGSSSSSPTSYLYHHFELGVGNYLKV